MVRKKTNYERKGFVRQIAGAVFSPPKEKTSSDQKWRPRKKLFEKLDSKKQTVLQEEDEDIIQTSFSIESDTAEYKRENHFDRKKSAFKQAQKRNLGKITIKPSARDNTNSRGFAAENKRRIVAEKIKYSADPFENSAFALHAARSDDSVETSSTKSKNPDIKTVNSDPTNFFSKESAKLTAENLEAMNVSENCGIENRNPRSEFHQFTIDEDKESTVILPVDYPGDTPVDFEDQTVDDGSQESSGVTSKGTHKQKRSTNSAGERNQDFFQQQSFFPDEKSSDESFDFFGVAKSQNKKDTSFDRDAFHSVSIENSFGKPSEVHVESRNVSNGAGRADEQGFFSKGMSTINTEPSVQDPSSHSLRYSPSPPANLPQGTKRRNKAQDDSKAMEPGDLRRPLRSSSFVNLPASANQLAKRSKLDPPMMTSAGKQWGSPFQDPAVQVSGPTGKNAGSNQGAISSFFQDSDSFGQGEPDFKSTEPSTDSSLLAFPAFGATGPTENQNDPFTKHDPFFKDQPATKSLKRKEEDNAFDGTSKQTLFQTTTDATGFFDTPSKSRRGEVSPRRPKSSQKSKTKIMVLSTEPKKVVPASSAPSVDPFDTSRVLFNSEHTSAATKVAQKQKSKYPMLMDVPDQNSFLETPFTSDDPFSVELRSRNDGKSSKLTHPKNNGPLLLELPDQHSFSGIPVEPVTNFDQDFAAFETPKTPPRNKVQQPKAKSVPKPSARQNAIAVKVANAFSSNEPSGSDPFGEGFAKFGPPRTPPRSQTKKSTFMPNSAPSKQTAKAPASIPSTFSTAQADPFDARFAAFEAPQTPPRDQIIQVKPKSSQKSKTRKGTTQQVSDKNDPFCESFSAFSVPSQPPAPQQETDSDVPKSSLLQRADKSSREAEGFIDFSQPTSVLEIASSESRDSEGFFDARHAKSSPHPQESKHSFESVSRGAPVDPDGFFDIPRAPQAEAINPSVDSQELQSRLGDSSPDGFADFSQPKPVREANAVEGNDSLEFFEAQPKPSPCPQQESNKSFDAPHGEPPVDPHGFFAIPTVPQARAKDASVKSQEYSGTTSSGASRTKSQHQSSKGGDTGRSYRPSSHEQTMHPAPEAFLNTLEGQGDAHDTAVYASPDDHTSVASSLYASQKSTQDHQEIHFADGQASVAASDLPSQSSHGEMSDSSSRMPPSQTSYGYEGSYDDGENESNTSSFLPSQVSYSDDQASSGSGRGASSFQPSKKTTAYLPSQMPYSDQSLKSMDGHESASSSYGYMSSSSESRNDQPSHGDSKSYSSDQGSRSTYGHSSGSSSSGYNSSSSGSRRDQPSYSNSKGSFDKNGRGNSAFHRAKTMFERGNVSSHSRDRVTKAKESFRSRPGSGGRPTVNQDGQSHQVDERQHGDEHLQENEHAQTRYPERQTGEKQGGGYLRQDIVQKGNFFPRRGAWTERVLPENDVILEPTTSSDSEETRSFTDNYKGSNSERPIGIASFSASSDSEEATSFTNYTRSNVGSSASEEKPIGIASFSAFLKGSASIRSGGNAASKSSSHHHRSVELCSHGKPKSLCTHVDECEEDEYSKKSKASSGSFGKPTGLPNNAIVASMLFRTHHNIDTSAVEARIKAREEEEKKMDSNRGDVPHAIHAMDGVSCVSSFSEDTGALQEAWRKPTRDLLDYFATSRRTDFDAKKYLKNQRQKADVLFEA